MENSEILQFLAVAGDRYIGAATRGILILGSLFMVFWVFKRPWMDKYRVPQIGTQKANPAKEAFLTFSTYIVYALAGAVVVFVHKKTGHTMVYTNVADYGWLYTIFSVFFFLFYSDTMFYWSHVLMHKSRLVYRTHVTHHQFINVTPWAAYAFHTGEAVINAGAFMLLMLLVPWHPIALLVFVVLSIVYNGLIHLGYDLFPKWWRDHAVLKWLNTTTHHIYHHQKSNCNYGFIFTFWDKVMKTEKLPDTYY